MLFFVCVYIMRADVGIGPYKCIFSLDRLVGAAICRVNCTQCKRHEAPNALAFGRNSPGDCFVASATIPPPPTAVPHRTGARPLCRYATSPRTAGSHPLQGRQKSYKFLRSLCLQLVPVSHPEKTTFFCSPLCRNAKIWYNSCETVCLTVSFLTQDWAHTWLMMEESIGLLIEEA